MRHTNRILILVSVLTALVPMVVGTRLLGDVQTDTRFKLDEALAVAGDANRDSARFETMHDQAEREAKEANERVATLGKQKRALRLQLAAVLKDVLKTSQRADEMLLSQEMNLRTFERQKEAVADMVRLAAADSFSAPGDALLPWSLRRLTGQSLGERVEDEQFAVAMARAREDLVNRLLLSRDADQLSRQALHAAAGERGEEGAALRAQLMDLQTQYLDALKDQDRALMAKTESESELKRIQQITAAVAADILAMQSELSRIDGRLRAKVERELVQKGLIDDSADRYKQHGPPTAGEFQMPVEGRISAGFMDADYKRHFGVPHLGMDIVVPQGTPVYSAADGIVYVVRRGGATGYTYVLIGHRDGYATLYGHLSHVDVTPGQRLGKGELVGLSGATPGTDGAGPMTTGPHLHFEVIHNGEHIDPRSVLQ